MGKEPFFTFIINQSIRTLQLKIFITYLQTQVNDLCLSKNSKIQNNNLYRHHGSSIYTIYIYINLEKSQKIFKLNIKIYFLNSLSSSPKIVLIKDLTDYLFFICHLLYLFYIYFRLIKSKLIILRPISCKCIPNKTFQSIIDYNHLIKKEKNINLKI